jgi:hypothetical protein
MPVDVMDEASRVTDVSGESVAFIVASTNVADAGSAAGTVVYGRLTNGGILDSMKARIGFANDTSLSFGTGTILTTLVEIDWAKLELENHQGLSRATRLANLAANWANGEYVIEHRTGIIVGKKATSGTSDTVSYSYRSSLITSVGGSSGVADDSAFTIATTTVTPAGYLADETATDSVDEGDVGIARMTLNRRIITASETTDDAAPETGTKLSLMGAVADETGPDSVDEGDAGYLRMTLTRFLKMSMGDLISGEAQSDNVMMVVEKPLAVSTYTPDMDTSAAAEASSVTKASPGVLFGISAVNSSGSGRYWQAYNSTTVPADSTVAVLSFYVAAGGSINEAFPKGRYFSTGIAWAWSSTPAVKTVGSTDGTADVRYK